MKLAKLNILMYKNSYGLVNEDGIGKKEKQIDTTNEKNLKHILKRNDLTKRDEGQNVF